MIRLDLLNVGLVEETGGILLVLRAPERHRLLVIETGLTEGEAIVLGAEGIRRDRPMTHDLLLEVIGRLGARVEEVRISEFHDETFFARIILVRTNDGGARLEFDCRPSDAIALAVRAKAPIYASDKVMADLGVPEERTGRFSDLFDEEDEEEQGPRIVH